MSHRKILASLGFAVAGVIVLLALLVDDRGRGMVREKLERDRSEPKAEAARVNPRLHEAEVPVSPITNLPVSALVDDYANLVEPRETVYLDDDADDSSRDSYPFGEYVMQSAATS